MTNKLEARMSRGESRLRATPPSDRITRVTVAIPLEVQLELTARVRGRKGGQSTLIAQAIAHFLRCPSVSDESRGGPRLDSKRV